MTFIILACALPQDKNWWPMMVMVFYLLAPIPTFVSRRNNLDGNHSCMDFAIFITMGLIVSSFALPIVLARAPKGSPVIDATACQYTLAGNLILYATYAVYFMYAHVDDHGGIW